MPPLKNIKHEMFARELVKEKGNQTEAYKKVYNVSSDLSASSNAAHLTRNHTEIRERVVEILNGAGLSLANLGAKLEKFVNSENEGIGLDATKFGFKLHGAIDPEQNGQVNVGEIKVAFVDVNRTQTERTDVNQQAAEKKVSKKASV